MTWMSQSYGLNQNHFKKVNRNLETLTKNDDFLQTLMSKNLEKVCLLSLINNLALVSVSGQAGQREVMMEMSECTMNASSILHFLIKQINKWKWKWKWKAHKHDRHIKVEVMQFQFVWIVNNSKLVEGSWKLAERMAAKIWKRDRRETSNEDWGHMFVSTSLICQLGRGRERWMGERRTSTGQQTSPFMGATEGGTKKCKAVPFIAFIIHHSQSNLHFERMRRAG